MLKPMQDFGVSLRKLMPKAKFLGAPDISAKSCCSDSRHVQPGDIFVAITGTVVDGHEHLQEAISRGAAAVVVERPVPAAGMPQCLVEDTRTAYGLICQALAGDPSDDLKVIGITGTNGKTTTTALTASLFATAGYNVGTIGTLGLDDSYRASPSTLTTPTAPVVAQWLSRMVAQSCSHAVMEVSSHALSQQRVAGVSFDAACFTNIRRDHLDFHNSLTNYRKAKQRLLDHLSPDGFVVLNADDPHCAALEDGLYAPLLTFGMQKPATVTATLVEQNIGDQTFLLCFDNEMYAVRSRMIGEHHVQNCLAAAALGIGYGISLADIARGLEQVEQVAGRMERIDCGQPFGVFVDYAHTPDALETSLAALKQVTQGRVICVFGAGGDRDSLKRPLMGAAVERYADQIIITSDNPRSEDPQTIAQQIQFGLNRPSQAEIEVDRARAIGRALCCAQPGDSVLIAGKGHEDYQVIGKRKYFFDDRQFTREMLYQLAADPQLQWAA